MPGSSFTRLLPRILPPLYTRIIETAGGTEKTRPIWTLTCDATLTGTTVGIENLTTGEKIEWTGDLDDGDELKIDMDLMLVYLNDIESMGTVDGQFPTLIPGANDIEVTGFSGALNIKYRERYV